MRDPKFVLVANESTWDNNDFMQIRRAVKKFWAYLSAKSTFLVYSCDQVM